MRELMSQSVPMPVARTASREEAELVSARLRDLGFDCLTLSDEELGLSFSDNAVKRVRSMTFDDERRDDLSGGRSGSDGSCVG